VGAGEEENELRHSLPEARETFLLKSSVVDLDPGSGVFLTPGPGSGIRNRFFPDLGSQIHILESLVKNFWVTSSIIL
jgi:hypothetical protein